MNDIIHGVSPWRSISHPTATSVDAVPLKPFDQTAAVADSTPGRAAKHDLSSTRTAVDLARCLVPTISTGRCLFSVPPADLTGRALGTRRLTGELTGALLAYST